MAQVVYNNVAQISRLPGNLFDGITFWLSQKVPQRVRFVDDVKSNGGVVTSLEKKADVKIVDHARKEQLPGTHSYTFIEVSVRNGVLEDLADHAVGPSEASVRSVGSVVRPAKATRSKFTAADDIIVWDWVNSHAQQGGGTDGNEIYKQLEAKHPQHPWQSWRDRYIKKLKGKPRPFALPHNAPPTPPADLQTSPDQLDEVQPKAGSPKDKDLPFTDEDAHELMTVGADIMMINPERIAEAWETWTNTVDPNGKHSPKQWQSFWEETVRLQYQNRDAERTQDTKKKGPLSSPQKQRESPRIISSHNTPRHASRSKTRNLPVRSPSYRPESPAAQTEASNPSPQKACHVGLPRVSSPKVSHTEPSPQILKRKLVELDEELPSSSPPNGVVSPKRSCNIGPGMSREIPSTPDRSPSRWLGGRGSPLFVENNEVSQGEGSPTFIEANEEENSGGPDATNIGVEGGELSSHNFSEGESIHAEVSSETSSEPDRSRKHTQALFREPTPFIDFNVAEPYEGWDDQGYGEEPGNSGADDASKITENNDLQSTIPETQAILHATTHLSDFDLPPPEGGWSSVPSSSPPFKSKQSQDSASQVSSSGVRDHQDLWVASYVDKGFSEEAVENVLWSTSLDMELAEDVLGTLRKGKRKSQDSDANGIPDGWRGVWTATDDQDLKSTDARSIKRLQEKHGEKSLQSRWEFLDFTEGSVES